MEEKQAELFKTLGVVSRLRIIELLKQNGKLGANEISENLGITPSAVSQHLKILKHAGLVSYERKGYWVPYEINPAALLHCYKLLANLCSCGCIPPGELDEDDENRKGDRIEFLKKFKDELLEELGKVDEELDKLEKEG